VLAASERSGACIVPYSAVCSCYWELSSWDAFVVPVPFSRVVVVLGEPICLGAGRTVECVSQRIDEAVAVGNAVLRGQRAGVFVESP
ncbi:MAG: hypothetical protein FWD57_14805, partial [Polyangiaceae bacterium]|nr:hypothetical protein [Polyangiaceae bacterium]